jgi:hypothetical protein
MATAGVAHALKGFSRLWSQQGLLWSGIVVAVLFMAAASVAMTASGKYALSPAAAAELVELKKGVATTTVAADGTSTTLFTPALNAGSVGVVFLSIAAVVLAITTAVGFYATRTIAAAAL